MVLVGHDDRVEDIARLTGTKQRRAGQGCIHDGFGGTAALARILRADYKVLAGRAYFPKHVLHVHNEARRAQQTVPVLVTAPIKFQGLSAGETAMSDTRHRVDDVGARAGGVACATRQCARTADGGCIEDVHGSRVTRVLVYYYGSKKNASVDAHSQQPLDILPSILPGTRSVPTRDVFDEHKVILGVTEIEYLAQCLLLQHARARDVTDAIHTQAPWK